MTTSSARRAEARSRRWRADRAGGAAAAAVALLAACLGWVPVAAATSASPTATADCTRSLQSLIDAAPAGSTLRVPPCVYRESVTVDKPLTIDGTGAIIDGRDGAGAAARDTWLEIAASNVTISGFTMRYADNKPQSGALRVVPGVSKVVIRDCDLGFAAGANVAIGTADDATLEGCAIHDAGQLGVTVGGDGGDHGHGNRVIGNRIYGNNTAGFDPEWEAGGLKATGQQGLVIRDNEVYDNAGPGLWCDIYCRDIVVDHNLIHDNTYAGIHFEVSTGADISANTIWHNGWGKTQAWWGAGILISSSGRADVHDNVVAWNAAGISVVSQDRQDWRHDATGNVVHDNTIAGDADRFLLAWVQDWDGELFLPASDNRGQGDRYWAPTAEPAQPRFAWDGPKTTLADFEQTPGEAGGRYLSTAEMEAALAAAGVPPGHEPQGSPVVSPDQVQRLIARYGLLAVGAGLVALLFLIAAIALWRRRGRSTRPGASASPPS